MIIHHTLNAVNEKPALNIGEIAANLVTRKIYAKSIGGDVYVVGDSLKYLTSLQDVNIENFSQGSILKFGYGSVLTADSPNISIGDLEGTTISSNTLDTAPYLYFNNNLDIENTEKPGQLFSSLSEFLAPSNKYQSNSYVVTYNWYNGETVNLNKNPFSEGSVGFFELKPEASRLVDFSDVGAGTAAKYHVLRTLTTQEKRSSSIKLKNDKFSISFDRKPALAGILNSDLYNTVAQQYLTVSFSLENSAEALVLDLNDYDIFNINCSNAVKTVNINFNYALNEDRMRGFLINIYNLTGAIIFPPTAVFENGIPDIRQGANTVLSGIICNNIIVLQNKIQNYV